MTRRVLIVDSVPTNRIVLRVKLATAYYEVAQAGSGAAALAAVERTRPDIVIAAADLPDMTGQGFCAALRALPDGGATPVVLVLSEDRPDQRLAALASGADDVLARPLDDLVLLARLRSLLRARDAEAELELRDDTRRALGLSEAAAEFTAPARIALLSPRIDASVRALAAQLSRSLPDHVTLMAPDEALRDSTTPPDVVAILETSVSQGAGLTVLAQLRAQKLTRHTALIYVAHPHQRREAAAALDMGANDLIAIGPEPEELALRIRKQVARKRIADRLRADMRDGLRAAVTDPLTGLYNRRYALPHLARVAERAAHYGKPFAVVMADLDHFKRINDTFGHPVGDEVLIALTQRMRDSLRASDLLARFGGEEFLVILPDADADLARQTAERLCRSMAQTPIRLPDGTQIPVTLSLGVAVHPPEGHMAPQALIDRADRALYAAKERGRNMVVMADLPKRGEHSGWRCDGPDYDGSQPFFRQAQNG